MKRKVALLLVVALCVMMVTPFASASSARLMPGDYYYVMDVEIPSSSAAIPLGVARFRVGITGMYDAQGDNVMSIDTEGLAYLGGVNCISRNVELVTWTTSNDRGYVFWQIVGEIVFGWTDPIFNTYIEEVVLFSPIYKFRANDYI